MAKKQPKKKPAPKKSVNKKKKKGALKTPTFGMSRLKDIAPFGNILFRSDHFRVGLYYGTVLTFTAEPGAITGQSPMWGYRLIPVLSDPEVTTRLVTAFQTRPREWVEARLRDADHLSTTTMKEAKDAGQSLEMDNQMDIIRDHAVVSREVSGGASYLDVTYKIVMYAPTLEQLKLAEQELNQKYKTRFGKAYLTQYIGQVMEDYRNLLAPAQSQIGLHDGYTSTELAGFYPILGKGWVDDSGVYVGKSAGDVNETPVFWDPLSIDGVAVVGSKYKAHMISDATLKFERPYMATSAWMTKISQHTLLAGKNVFELVLTNEKVQDIGWDLSASTSIVNMDQGVVNPFQAFGDVENELQAFGILINKIKAMFYQINDSLGDDHMAVLENLLNDFYIHHNLWADNPAENRDDLRLVQLRDSRQFPRLTDLSLFTGQRYVEYAEGTATRARNANMADKYETLVNLMTSLERSHGHLFNVHTTFDEKLIDSSPRKVFAFGDLQQQGNNILMAQFINILSFVVSRMKPGDSLHIYGAEMMSQNAWDVLSEQIYFLKNEGISLVLGFNSSTEAIRSPFFTEATTTILGQLSAVDIKELNSKSVGVLPQAIAEQMTKGNDMIYYLRRNQQNGVFYWDMVV